MYCPRCGRQQNSGELRFCPRCGLKLDPVRACLPEPDGAAPDAPATLAAARRGDINAGVLVVFLSVLLTGAFVAFTNAPLAGASLFLVLVAAPLLAASGRLLGALRGLFSDDEKAARVGVRPREVGFGAALMLACTALSLCAAFAFGRYGAPAFFSLLAASLPALLLSSQSLMRGAQKLFAVEAPRRAAASESVTTALPGRFADGDALPPAEGVPVSLFVAREQPTAEMSPPRSVAERTTGLLDGD